MNKSDFDGFAQLLAAEVEVRGKPALSEGAILLWWDRLSGYELAAVQDGFRRHSRDAERGRWMPQPADIIAQIDGTAADRAALAWSKLLDAMGRVGAYTDVVFDDPAIHACIEDLGGWPKLCRTEMSELGFVRHRFTESHRAYTGRATFDYPKQLMGDRSPDHEYERRGLPLPTPAVVGDLVRARQVLLGGTAGGKTQITSLPALAAKALALA